MSQDSHFCSGVSLPTADDLANVGSGSVNHHRVNKMNEGHGGGDESNVPMQIVVL